MNELTKRLRDGEHGFDRNGSHSEGRYVCLCEHLANQAADRIDALEDSERVILASVPEEHRASTAAGTAQNYIAHLEGRIDALEEALRELIDKGDTFGGELRAIKREDERAAWDKARALLEAHD
jgi:hypothetical protein